jgi:hypothetical protein
MNPPESLAPRVTVDAGHWLWNGALNRDGYGRLVVARRLHLAHRYVYEQFVAPIPEGMCIDHTCRVRHCVNPDHLRVVTPTQNALENSLGRGAVNASRTHCPNGHPFEGRNLIRTKAGQRLCRTCRNAYMRELMARRYAARQSA